MKKFYSFLIAAIFMLAIPMGMKGQKTYQLQQVTTVEVGGLYVFEQGGHVMNNTVSSSALQTTTTYATTGLIGTESYVWTLETATDGFYLKNVSLNSSQYLNNSSSTNVSFGNKSSIWNLNFQTDQTVLIQNKSNSNRFLGYTNSTSYAYKAYATNNLNSYSHAIKVYQLVEEGSTPTTYSVTFDAGEGTFVGNTDFPSTSNTVAAGTYTLPSATPAIGYTFDGWVATGITAPITGSYTVSGAVAFTAHYTQNATSGTATYTITSTSAVSASGQAPSGSSATFSQTYNTKCQMTSGNSMTLTLGGYQGKVVTGITLNMKSNGSSGAGWMYAKAGNNTLASIGSENNGVAFSDDQWNGSYTSSYTDVTIGMSDDSYAIQNDENLVIFIKATQNSLYCQSFTITWGNASSITRPQFSPAGGIYTSAQNVTISGETGATIYYTTDGSQPTTNSTQYNGAISIESTTTLKAIAVVNGESSNVTSATYTILNPLTTMQAIFDNATATPASHEVVITFDNWVISGQNGSQTTGSGANKAWLTDNNGKGCSIYNYNNNLGLMANNVLNGTVICNLQLYNGSAQITGVNSATTDINGNTIVSTGGAITTVETTIGNLSGVSTGAVVKLNHLRCVSAGTTSNTLTDGTNTIYAKKNLYSSLSFVEGKIYDLTGVFEYSSSTSTIYPRSAADVVEAPTAPMAIGTLTNVTGLNVFYVYDEINPIISEGQSSAQQQVYVGEEIMVSPEVAAHCAIQSLIVTDGDNNPVTVIDHMTDGGYYSFIMPSSGASITATASVAQQYTLTVVGDHVSITQLLVGEESDIVSLDANNQALIYEQAEVEVDGLTVDAAFMIESVTIEYGNTSLEVTKNDGGLYAFTMPSSNATLTFTTTTAPTYTLTTTIESGKTYIIVGFDGDDAYAMGVQNTNNRAGVGITVDGNTAIGNAEVHEVVITALDGGKYTIEDGGYLYAASSSSNHLKTETTLNDNGKWTIEIAGNGDATITAQGSNNRNLMRFNPNTNNGSPLFACYATNNDTGSLPKLYVKDEPATETYTLTINGYGNDINVKTGWNLIASPIAVDPANIQEMVVENNNPDYQKFDLYYFDETGGTNEKEWKNYKNSHFNLELGKGYLYANANTVGLTFTGIENGDFADVENLPFVDGNSIQSLYLAGNSKTTAETFYVYDNNLKKQTVNFLTINEDGNGFTTTTANSFEADALQGFFVQSAGQGWTLSTTNLAKGRSSEQLNVKVSRNRGTLIDNAIVSFGNAPQLNKFYLFDNTTRVYIPQNGEEMAVVRSEAQGEMPVNFKANQSGEYTISINTENVEMNYLHLIDNLTGNDVDLLATPSYTFNAMADDYASRFRLVFSANNAESNNDNFAFISDGQIVLTEQGDAQVFDIMGRMISRHNNVSHITTEGLAAGVYVIRLTTGSETMTQKIVVK